MGSIFSRKKSHRERNTSSRKFDVQQNNEYVERDQNSNRRMQQQVDYRVLTCFCGCTPLHKEQIEQFTMMNVNALIAHPIGRPLLRNFFRIGQTIDKSAALIAFECFEICDKILTNQQYNRNDIDELVERLPSFAWEERINAAVQNDIRYFGGQMKNLYNELTELKTECVRNIECHNDYDRFRRELLRKINK